MPGTGALRHLLLDFRCFPVSTVALSKFASSLKFAVNVRISLWNQNQSRSSKW